MNLNAREMRSGNATYRPFKKGATTEVSLQQEKQDHLKMKQKSANM